MNEEGQGFLRIRTSGEAGGRPVVLIGQLDPDEVRQMVMAWLGAAEAAEQDAAVLRTIRKLELPDDLAMAVVIELRDSRTE